MKYPLIISAILLAVLASILPPGANAQEDKPGQTYIFITYRCKAADRPAFLEKMKTDGKARFDAWKKEGVMADYQLLFNTVVEEHTWDMMAVIRFERYTQTDRWRAVEEKYPGGLSQELLALATPVHTIFGDTKWQNSGVANAKDTAESFFVAIPYYWKDKAVYTNYASVYVVPAFDKWITEGAIRGYRIIYNMYPTGENWSGILLFEYRGADGLAIRDKIKQKVRAMFKDDAAFQFMGQNKREVREEGIVTITRDISQRRDGTGGSVNVSLEDRR